MDIDNLMQKYHNVSKEELEKILETSRYPTFNEVIFETRVCLLHDERENEKRNGRDSIIAGPLFQMLSVHVLNKIDPNKTFNIYGRIYVEFRDTASRKRVVHDLYHREYDDAEVLGPSGNLTLISPDHSCWPFNLCIPLHDTKLIVDIHAGGKKLFVQKFLCPHDTSDTEQVKLEDVHSEFGSLSLLYISMPFAVYGRVEVLFFKSMEEKNRSFNVNGKIVARYSNTYGSYYSQECTLFEKQNHEFEQVAIDPRRSMGCMRLSRCWVGVPAYSFLMVELDLSEFGTEKKILKETVEFRVENQSVSRRDFTVDDIVISVRVGWWSPKPQGKCSEEECVTEPENESSEDEMSLGSSKEDSRNDQMNEPCVRVHESSSNIGRAWIMRAHQNRPISASSVEIFSVFIGRENFKALQIYGSIEVSSYPYAFYLFKREAKDGPYELSEYSKLLPVLDGSRVYEDCDSLEIKFDLKDVRSHLQIRGYVHWDTRSLDPGSSLFDKQLCSIVSGEHGFAAIHYSIFSEGVQANVEVLCKPKSGHDDAYLKIYGSLVAHYNNYDYTSHYNKKYYRVVLFERNREDPAQPGVGGVIALSRSKVVVPLKSSLIVEANIWNGVSNQVLSFCSAEFQIDTTRNNSMNIEGNECSIHINVKWSEVSS